MTAPNRPTHSAVPSVSTAKGSEAGAPAGGASGRAPAQESPLPRSVLERVRERDPEALGLFFEHYFERVYRVVYRLLGERAAAEDVTQDVFAKVHRAAGQLDPARDPGPWLTAIAYNSCRDLWRSGAFRLARHSSSIESDPAIAARLTTGANDPELDLLAAERHRLVREAIERLPEPLRLAILLYDYQGMSHQEIAERMGIQHTAARKRYSRALAALGRMLKGTLG